MNVYIKDVENTTIIETKGILKVYQMVGKLEIEH